MDYLEIARLAPTAASERSFLQDAPSSLPLAIKTIHKESVYFYVEGEKLDRVLAQASRGEENGFSINALLFRALAYEDNSGVKQRIIKACSRYPKEFSQESIADLLLNGEGQPFLESSRAARSNWNTLCDEATIRTQVVRTIEKLGSELPTYRVARAMMTAMDNLQQAILSPTPLYKELAELSLHSHLRPPVWKVLAKRLNWETTRSIPLEQTAGFYVAARIRQMAQEETKNLSKLVAFGQLLALVDDASFVRCVMDLANARDLNALPDSGFLFDTDPITRFVREMHNPFS